MVYRFICFSIQSTQHIALSILIRSKWLHIIRTTPNWKQQTCISWTEEWEVVLMYKFLVFRMMTSMWFGTVLAIQLNKYIHCYPLPNNELISLISMSDSLKLYNSFYCLISLNQFGSNSNVKSRYGYRNSWSSSCFTTSNLPIFLPRPLLGIF